MAQKKTKPPVGLVDGDALTAFCRERAGTHATPLVGAIYAGLADRLTRGDFAPAGGVA